MAYGGLKHLPQMWHIRHTDLNVNRTDVIGLSECPDCQACLGAVTAGYPSFAPGGC